MPGDESSFCRSDPSQAGQTGSRFAVTKASNWRPQPRQAYSNKGIWANSISPWVPQSLVLGPWSLSPRSLSPWSLSPWSLSPWSPVPGPVKIPAMKRLFLLLSLAVAASGTLTAQGPRLVVLNKEDATLVTVDPATGKVLGRVPTGEAPHEVTVSDDGKTAFVGNYGASSPGNTISIIDLGKMKEIRRFDTKPLLRPHGVFFRDRKVYFTSETHRIVARYDPASNQVDWLLGTGQAGTHMVWVNKDATRMYACNIGGASMTIIERGADANAWNETVVPVGKGPEGFDVSPDGREIWAAHSRDGGVSIVDIEQKKVVGTIDLKTKRSNRLKFTPDGKVALVSDLDAGELLVIDVASRAVTKKIPLGKMVEGILMQPDGARAYVAVNGDNYVGVIDLKTLTVTGRIETGKGPDGMAWVK
jgi:YVTN family beta-propeller protein